jgi:hypothetical protein
MSNSQLLQVHIDADLSKPVTGLLAIRIHFADESSFPEYKARFVFSPDSAISSYEMALTPARGNNKTQFVIHTHYLPNGLQPIALTITAPSGEILWSGEISLNVMNQGRIASDVRKSLQQFRTPVVTEGPCDSTNYDYSDQSILPWYDRPEALERLANWLDKGEIDFAEFSALKQFVEQGYAILPEKIADSLIEQVNREVDEAVAQKYSGYTYGSSQRLEHMHLKYPGIRQLWNHPMILSFLAKIFREPALPCQTLTYVFGSQQDAHQDTVHLTPFPAGYMCGVWIALEDVQPGSGELEIYPGSHRLPRVYLKNADCQKVKDGDWAEFGEKVVARWQKMVNENRAEKVVYRPQRGTVLVWHENLMHAGSPRENPSLSRKSIVTHNFASGCLVYYDSTGIAGSVYFEGADSPPGEKKKTAQPEFSAPAISDRAVISGLFRRFSRLLLGRNP